LIVQEEVDMQFLKAGSKVRTTRHVLAAAALLIVTALPPGSADAWDIESAKLPAFILAYTFIVSSQPQQFAAQVDAAAEGSLFAEFKQFESQLAKINPDLPTGLSFVKSVFIVQSAPAGTVAGFVRKPGKTLEQSGVPFESMLFVSTPIPALGNRVIMILSSVSPERTVMVTVDAALQTDLVYDSFLRSTPKTIRRPVPIGSLYAVRTQGPGRFLLQERMVPGGRGFVSPKMNRVFVLRIAQEKIELFEEKKGRK
jgi:hypothetical protein